MNVEIEAEILTRLSLARWPVLAADKESLNPCTSNLWLHSRTWTAEDVVGLDDGLLSQVAANTIEQWARMHNTHRLYALHMMKGFDAELGQISCQLRFEINHI